MCFPPIKGAIHISLKDILKFDDVVDRPDSGDYFLPTDYHHLGKFTRIIQQACTLQNSSAFLAC